MTLLIPLKLTQNIQTNFYLTIIGYNYLLQGRELVKSYLENMPELPGVYRFLDIDSNIIYIGKAKNLRKRLTQYTLDLEQKNKIMVSLARSIEYSVTESESAALLLEGQLIKKFKPRFNILLKDDKSFPYIKLRNDHDYPQLLKFRGKNLFGGKFFGPFASPAYVDTTLMEVHKIFKLRSCSDSYFATRKRPCIQYQIKRCCAPCVGKVSKEEYNEIVAEVKAFLSGRSSQLQAELARKMEDYSNAFEYEKAGEIRDKLKAISYVQLKSQDTHNLNDADIIAIAGKHGQFCVQMFLYRGGSPCGNQAYFPEQVSQDATIEDVLSAFIMQIYQNKTPAKDIILSHKIEDSHLYLQALRDMHQGLRIKITTARIGAKAKLVENAIYNAELALQKQLKISAKNIVALKEVARIFVLESVPRRIEIYDNSHIQGAFAIGAMVVAAPDGFNKKEYRLFNIKEPNRNLYGGDDYQMLGEVMKRRLKRIKQDPSRIPDLMIIDGGKGHMGVVKAAMDELDIHIPFVCMSKGVDRNSGREYFHQPDRESFTLDKTLPVMKYLQILRDEVHSFAIKSHRKKRSAAIKISSLDKIRDIGEIRKKALLNYFGSFANVADATIDDLSKVEGISAKLAEKIYYSLH